MLTRKQIIIRVVIGFLMGIPFWFGFGILLAAFGG
jgi:type III secretory pathway component EscT